MAHITLNTPDGFTLDADFQQGTSSKGVVFAHGIANDIYREEPFVQAVEKLHELGLSTLLLNFRAHGKSSGNSIKDFTIANQLIDLQTAVEFIKQKGATHLGLAGASFGGAASCLFVKKYPDVIQSLLLENPVLDYGKAFLHPTTPWSKKYFEDYQQLLDTQRYVPVGSKQYKLGPKMFEEMKEYFPLQALQTFTGPLFILHGDKDTILSYEDCIEYFEQIKNPKKKLTIIPGGEHGFHEEPYTTQVADKIVEFFNK